MVSLLDLWVVFVFCLVLFSNENHEKCLSAPCVNTCRESEHGYSLQRLLDVEVLQRREAAEMLSTCS